MSQMHNIIKSFNELILFNPIVSARIPGGIHHGKRVPENTPRPYGVIDVREESREYHSGFGSLAKYTATLSIYNSDKVGTTGETQDWLASVFDLAYLLPSVYGTLMLVKPKSGSIEEDDNEIQGKDVLVSKNVWSILINE